MSDSRAEAGNTVPWICSITSRSASGPGRRGAPVIACQSRSIRARAAGSVGSTSRRSRATELRRRAAATPQRDARPPAWKSVGPGPGALRESGAPPRLHAGRDLFHREVAQPQNEVVEAVGVFQGVVRIQALQAQLQLGQGPGIDELAQFGLAQELAQLARGPGESLGPPLREGGGAVVE